MNSILTNLKKILRSPNLWLIYISNKEFVEIERLSKLSTIIPLFLHPTSYISLSICAF